MADILGLRAQAALNRQKAMDSRKELAEFDKRMEEQFQEFKAYAASRIAELLANDELKEFLKSKAGLSDVFVSMKKSVLSHNITDYSLSLGFEYNEIVLFVGHRVIYNSKYSDLAFSDFINGLVAMDIPYKDYPKRPNTKMLLLKNL